MKIAIASSGLGHIARGIETWACDTAVALSQLSVNGYSLWGNSTNNDEKTTNNDISVTLFCAAHPALRIPHPASLQIRVVHCLKRGDRLTRFIARWAPGFTWRRGWKSAYDIEQRSFWRRLWPILRDERYDILHVQDPLLADLCRRYRKAGKLATREILAHGTEEPVEFLGRFDYLQELTPHYAARHVSLRPGQSVGVAPNFVDTVVFTPSGSRKVDYRKALGIPDPAFVVLSVGSINRERKRMDYLVSEFLRWNRPDAVLVIAGACDTDESWALIRAAKASLGNGLIVLDDLERARMPLVYGAADVFVLCAMRELFGIAFLEAMSCGIPCIGHKYPVTEWVIGDESGDREAGIGNRIGCAAGQAPCEGIKPGTVPGPSGGITVDMGKTGALAEVLAGLTPEWIAEHGRQARERAVKMFSREVVIEQYVEYYRRVCGVEAGYGGGKSVFSPASERCSGFSRN